MIHVRDVAKVTRPLLDAPEESIRGQAVNVGSAAQNYRTRDLAEVLSEVTGCAVEIAEGSSADNRSYRVDFSKLGALLPGLVLDWNVEAGPANWPKPTARWASRARTSTAIGTSVCAASVDSSTAG
jgi:nucleoside-diphosphate-sugar epimerase